MKALKTFALLLALQSAIMMARAQQEYPGSPSTSALLFADSLERAFRNNNLNEYVAISYPGVIRYYGGTRDFREYIQRTRNLDNLPSAENPEKLRVVQIVNQSTEWQCVVERTKVTMLDGRKAQVISYLVGQSKDAGITWKYFDVAYNSPDNLIYIMPDIFDSLMVPQRKIIFENNQLVSK